jgi:hypothetical protein
LLPILLLHAPRRLGLMFLAPGSVYTGRATQSFSNSRDDHRGRAGFQVEMQLMSLPGVKAESSEPENPAQPHAPGARPLDEIDQYLWSVYLRSGTKRDSTGDFTWKDEAATVTVMRDTASERANSRLGDKRSPGRSRPSRMARRIWR